MCNYLDNFEIFERDIDRLYFVKRKRYRYRPSLGESYEIVARVNPLPKYVKLYIDGMYSSGVWRRKQENSGSIYISEDPNTFIKVIGQDETKEKKDNLSLKCIIYTQFIKRRWS